MGGRDQSERLVAVNRNSGRDHPVRADSEVVIEAPAYLGLQGSLSSALSPNPATLCEHGVLRESRPDKNSLWFSFSDKSIYS
jgi:hypothetical protein